MAPPILVHEEAVEIPNGTRIVFSTTALYVAGTVRAWRNGQLLLKRLADGGFVEIGNKKVRFFDAPLTEDVIIFQYRPLA